MVCRADNIKNKYTIYIHKSYTLSAGICASETDIVVIRLKICTESKSNGAHSAMTLQHLRAL